ncbi:spore germination protein [Paenibacillus sp. HWE-109]|uniref:GerAB/ArcD/ProY family transporter n=1 Tax=Paenibacillus sp. HWE-109 TaxID=1306526 RepID=UPI001EDFD7F7|nr:endospore germination permease [Paenibacillus sp. HWE-109]UKS28248.1 spore germination protein [Paenibacillus sp. HWE-109]
MKNMESISSFQVGMLFLAGMTGSSIVLIPGPLAGAAKNGAWISFLLAFALGMFILTCVLYLQRKYPGMAFIEYSRQSIGKWLTIIVAVPYICAMFWQVAAIVIEIGGFFKSTMMKETPSYAINCLFFIVIALTARAGIEVMARMFVVLLFMMFGFIFLVLALVSPYFHPEFLLPIIPDGIKPVLHGAYIAYGFPYVEVALYAAILPFVRKKDKDKIGKYMVFALIINGITLLASIVCSIMVLGPLTGELKYSLFLLARLIFIQEILERTESVIGFSLIIGSYMKTSILLFILTNVISQLFKLKDDRILTYPIAVICLLLSITMYPNEPSFMEDGYVMWTLFDNFAYLLPLILIIIVTIFRSKKSGTLKIIPEK